MLRGALVLVLVAATFVAAPASANAQECPEEGPPCESYPRRWVCLDDNGEPYMSPEPCPNVTPP